MGWRFGSRSPNSPIHEMGVLVTGSWTSATIATKPSFKVLVGRVGIEPTTFRFRVGSSASELPAPLVQFHSGTQQQRDSLDRDLSGGTPRIAEVRYSSKQFPVKNTKSVTAKNQSDMPILLRSAPPCVNCFRVVLLTQHIMLWSGSNGET